MKHLFEGAILQSRLIILLAVVASLVSAVMLFIMAAGGVFKLALDWFLYVIQGGYTAFADPGFHAEVIAMAVGSITSFLLAMLLFIMAWGLYELFISKLSSNGSMASQSSDILVIRNLDDLTDRIIKVALLILVVQFFNHALHVTMVGSLGFLYLGGGILMVAIALHLGHLHKAK